MITQSQKDIILQAAKKYNPSYIGIYGSYARGENSEGSDLDILMDFEGRVNLLDIIGLEQELSILLGVKVDLVTKRSLSKYVKVYVERDLKRIN
jgi:hypothetical protein